MAQHPIENHGVIGDLHTVALVALDATIDFLCFPHFDSPTIFASLLDEERGGYFKIVPCLTNAKLKQLYLPDTNVLLTRFLHEDGVVEITDFMPVKRVGHAHHLVRLVKTVRGKVDYEVRCAPRFDFGRSGHDVTCNEGELIFMPRSDACKPLRLSGSFSFRLEDGDAVATFSLGANESAAFVLSDAPINANGGSTWCTYGVEAFDRTIDFWRAWISRCHYKGRWREIVYRSALILKLLCYEPSGAMVAAPTFGLPETVKGQRNWDYRYTWIRDTSFAIYALMRLGYRDEAKAFMGWIEARCRELADGGSLQIMYGLNGEEELTETTLDHFSGFLGSKPVRIGNGAYDQLQLDIYGELLDAVYLFNENVELISHDFWQNLTKLIEWVRANWRRPDDGIWEVRGGAREFLYSRLMCWVAIDRGLRIAQTRSFPCPEADWKESRDEIYIDILRNFWDEERCCFVQAKGNRRLDAAALMMPIVKFMGFKDPRWMSTVAAIESELVDDSLVHRYQGDPLLEGVDGQEGSFTMCSFWYVQSLAQMDKLDKARLTFEKTISYANHLGLFSEELGKTGEHLGNFPQALTHLALIGAAYMLDRRLTGGSAQAF